MNKSVISVVLIIISIVLVVCWFFWDYVSKTEQLTSKPYNIVLIGVDTLRFDHVSLLDLTTKQRDLTPNLRKLAEKGTVFQSAISQAPWTMPAFASILTGKYPPEHGAVSLKGALRKSEVTIAEILRFEGYFTAGIVSHLFVDSKHFFDQGFNYFNDDFVFGHDAITSEKITNQAIKVLDGLAGKKFFLFLHYFDPHYNYKNHEEWDFADKYSGWLLDVPQDIQNFRDKQHLVEPVDIEYLKDLYDEEIAYTDKHIGRLIDYMQDKGLDKNTVFVFVADHGEEFMERGRVGHTITLYNELIKVPMFIILPDSDHKKTVVKTTVETRRVFDTILDYLHISEKAKIDTEGLLEVMDKSFSATEGEYAYSSVWLSDALADSNMQVMLSSIQNDHWKLILDRMNRKEFFFDLINDKDEKVNLSGTQFESRQEMKALLDEWVDKMLQYYEDVPRLDLNEKEINRLKSLGYL